MIRKEIINKNREYRYRSGESTLEEREKKKLLESTTWFRQNGQDKDEGEQLDKEGKEGKEVGMSNWRKKGKTGGRKNTSKMMEVEGKWKIIGVLFIQHTQNSELAKRLRGKLEILEKVENIKLKIVERTGEKIVDLVHRSNAWSNLDCQRKDCLICESCVGEEMRGMCYKRNVIYETFCLTCEDKVEERNGVDIVNEENEEVED